MFQLDVRGLDCPQPLLEFKNQYEAGGNFMALIDSEVAKENILRFCKNNKIKYTIEEGEDIIIKVEC
ncbi:sulfurtransferase TusA family protein [Proteinivorax hydrogeniformans]|uniref:Sulfurtransferase TusA family protein n=1 Tax=Proteinivorax hydrogeniformans TaxID=1826727 RepID=A0AAU8HT08_9FIRM